MMVFVLAMVMLMPMAGMAEAATAAPAADTGGAVVEIPGVRSRRAAYVDVSGYHRWCGGVYVAGGAVPEGAAG